MFRKDSLPSSFITNFGDDLMGLLVVFAIFIASYLASFIVNKWMRNIPTVRIILHRVSLTCQNFLVGSFAESLGPISFYATLEFRNSNPEEEYYALSPIVCMLSLVLALCIIFLCGWILGKFQAIRKNSSEEEKKKAFELLEKKYEGAAVLFEEFEDSSILTQSAFLLFSLRALIESLIICLLFKYPMAQSILLLVLTFPLLTYILMKKPFKSKLDLAQQLMLISLLFVCNFCLTIMTGTDLTEKN